MATVFLADDHPLFVSALTRALDSRGELSVIGWAADGREALREIAARRPDVAVVDLELPSLPGLELLEAAQRERLATRMAVVSAHLDAAHVHRAVAAGARGYLDKSRTAADVAAMVARVAAGETVLGPAAGALADAIRRRTPVPALSATERAVLAAAADGLPAAAIAVRLDVDERAVREALERIYARLEVGDRAAAVAVAIRHGLL